MNAKPNTGNSVLPATEETCSAGDDDKTEDKIRNIKQKFIDREIENLSKDETRKLCMDYMELLRAVSSYDSTEAIFAIAGLERTVWNLAEQRSTIATALIDGNAGEILVKMIEQFLTVGVFKSNEVFRCTQYVLISAGNFSDISLDVAKNFVDNGMVPLLLKILSHKPFLNKGEDSNESNILDSTLTAVFNLAKVPEAKPIFTECNGLEVLKPFTKSNNDDWNATSALALAYIIEEDQNHVLADAGCITFIIQCLGTATEKFGENVEKKDRRRCLGFTPQELAEGLGNLAVTDGNKIKIVDGGALPLFVRMMQYKDPEEQLAAARAVWNLAFDDQIKPRIINEPGCMDTLETLKEHGKGRVRRAAEGALWVIKDSVNDGHRHKAGTRDKRNHVFISYNTASQKTVVKIAERLKADGFRVWIDVDQMAEGGSTLDAMANAVEDAAVVLICLSEKYKLSPNCKTEAEYTFQLRTPIVPLLLQPKYRADGWLGMIVGAKFYINFDGKFTFDKAYGMLLQALAEKGKSVDQIDTAEVATPVGTAPPVYPAPPKSPKPYASSVSKWSRAQVSNWFTKHGLDSCKDKFAECNGSMLESLNKIREENIEVLYKLLDDKFELNGMEILKFICAIETLHTGR